MDNNFNIIDSGCNNNCFKNTCNNCSCKSCPLVPKVLGWMRSSETYGFVPGARIPNIPPADGVYTGWDYAWAREATKIQYFENYNIFRAAVTNEYTKEALGINESLFPIKADRRLGRDFVWDGGTGEQYFKGYYEGNVPCGWASWENVSIANDELYSPQTRENVPGVYGPFHYSLRRFTSYLDVNFNEYDLNGTYLVSVFKDENCDIVFPINDSIFVFVNGNLVYWASSDVIGSSSAMQNRSYFYDVKGIIPIKDYPGSNPPEDGKYIFTDGWYMVMVDLYNTFNIAPFLKDGKNVIDVITDDFFFGGGMPRLKFLFDLEPRC